MWSNNTKHVVCTCSSYNAVVSLSPTAVFRLVHPHTFMEVHQLPACSRFTSQISAFTLSPFSVEFRKNISTLSIVVYRGLISALDSEERAMALVLITAAILDQVCSILFDQSGARDFPSW